MHTAILFLGTYPREWKTYIYVKTWTQVIMPALFIIVKEYKEFKCPSADKQINKMWLNHIIEQYSVIKRTEVLIYATTQMNRENILSERNQIQKDTTI